MNPGAPQPGHVYVAVYLIVARVLLCASAVYLTVACIPAYGYPTHGYSTHDQPAHGHPAHGRPAPGRISVAVYLTLARVLVRMRLLLDA